MIGQDAKSGKFAYYVCGTLNKKGAGSCEAHYLNSRKFEESVIRTIRENILTEEHLRRLVELVNQEMDTDSRQHQGELEAVLEDINYTNRRLERLYDAVETGKIPLADLALRISDLRKRIEKLQARKIQIENLLSDKRIELASPEIVSRFVRDMRRVLEESELTEKRAFLRSFIKRIQVTGREAVLTYTMPINGLIEQKIGVLPIVQYGRPWLTVPELLFEKKELIPMLQQLLISYHT